MILLVIDVSDLNMGLESFDVRVNLSRNFTVNDFKRKICDGIREFARTDVPDPSQLQMLAPDGNPLPSYQSLYDLSLADWDTLFLRRR